MAPGHAGRRTSRLIIGGRHIHKREAQTPVTLVQTDQGWGLVAKEGNLLGYVAQRDLTAVH